MKNLILVIKDQMPLKRFIRNFFITRNAWGLFSKNSHRNKASGSPKVGYNTKASALKAAASMHKKYGHIYSAYKCLWCSQYHVGKNRAHNGGVAER